MAVVTKSSNLKTGTGGHKKEMESAWDGWFAFCKQFIAQYCFVAPRQKEEEHLQKLNQHSIIPFRLVIGCYRNGLGSKGSPSVSQPAVALMSFSSVSSEASLMGGFSLSGSSHFGL